MVFIPLVIKTQHNSSGVVVEKRTMKGSSKGFYDLTEHVVKVHGDTRYRVVYVDDNKAIEKGDVSYRRLIKLW